MKSWNIPTRCNNTTNILQTIGSVMSWIQWMRGLPKDSGDSTSPVITKWSGMVNSAEEKESSY